MRAALPRPSLAVALAAALVPAATTAAGPGAGASRVEAILALEPDPEAGAFAYRTCAPCHGPAGEGRPDGTFPRLAGQHRSVLVKQIVDIREGDRRNPAMAPFAKSIPDEQQIADIAAWLERLPSPRDRGRGPGEHLERGAALYRRDCAQCHGARGQGNAEAAVPALAAQHYRYLLRQIRAIAAGRRGNAHPEMQERVSAYSDAELAAVVDYASRLADGPALDVAD